MKKIDFIFDYGAYFFGLENYWSQDGIWDLYFLKPIIINRIVKKDVVVIHL